MKIALLLPALAFSSCVGLSGTEFPVSAQRPTLASDTATTAAGTLEVELGGVWDPRDSASASASLKFGAGEKTEVFLNWSPIVYQEDSGESHAGTGDVGLGVRRRLFDARDHMPSIALQSAIKIPTANEDDGLGTGEFDAGLAGIATKAYGDFVVTAFYGLDALGDPNGGSDLAHSGALSTSLSLSDQFGAFIEIAGISIPDQSSDIAFSTLGMTYLPLASLGFDLGLVVGLSDEAPDLQLVAGFTRNLGRAMGQ